MKKILVLMFVAIAAMVAFSSCDKPIVKEAKSFLKQGEHTLKGKFGESAHISNINVIASDTTYCIIDYRLTSDKESPADMEMIYWHETNLKPMGTTYSLNTNKSCLQHVEDMLNDKGEFYGQSKEEALKMFALARIGLMNKDIYK